MIVDIQGKVKNERLNWMGKNHKTKRKSVSDVSISEGNVTARGYVRYTVTFRNSIHELFGNYVDFAAYKDRLFIAPPLETGCGYKLHTGDKNKNPFCQITKSEDTCALSEFIGDFEVEYDDFLDLYYITKGEQ